MSPQQRVCKSLGILGLALAVPALAFGQPSYVTQGGEYAPAGNLPGDQTYSSLSLGPSGGYLVWQDNITDGDGLGISAIRLDSSFSGSLATFRVNQQGAGDQERPQVSLLKSGGAAFVWQGGKQSFQHIYARFLSSSNTWVAGDVMVNTATNYQINPVIATLTNGNVIVAWGSYNQDAADGLQGVYAQQLSPTGQKVGGEFPVNQFTAHNQRTPAMAALSSGGFVVVWVSEGERATQSVGANGAAGAGYNSVDVYARLYNSAGVPLSNEILVNTGTNICANPTVAAASDGSFIVVWGQKDTVVRNNSWDVFSRRFSATGSGGAVLGVNTQLYGDQYAPKISSVGTDYLVVWTSLGQDGSREGVYGQFLRGDGSASGGEFRVNTTILNQQEFQAVASDGAGRFLVTWSSYAGGLNSLDLYAQRYATFQQPLAPLGAPFVSALSSYNLSVTWPPLAGFSVDHFNLYVDGSATPVAVTNTMWENQGFYSPGSTHTFQLTYVLTDGRVSPLSAVATGTTWGADGNFDGLPDDWQARYWGPNPANWPPPSVHLGGSVGPTVVQVFLWGSNPLDPGTWLKAGISHTYQGWFLSWNTQPGLVYQVEASTDFTTWSDLGSPRFAAGSADSLYLGLANNGYYRIKRIR